MIRGSRLKSNRVFYRPAPPPTGKRGAPRKDGERLKSGDPSTHGEPSQHWEGQDANGRRIDVDCWGQCPLNKKNVPKGLPFEREALMPGLLATEGGISTLEDARIKAETAWRKPAG